ncbi:unnamed protein product [Fraxinus pennsylvanica]|uniref:Uncharacterized protein n=1 Tax=Fraxinus pennsylvanica TaxID=56036 RepID=A0AAD2DR59_9LAMI|nr:unnamed protein product [Fraxinus pennsylvanica]
MDVLCLKAGIQGISPPISVTGYAGMDVLTSYPSQISASGRPSEKSVAAAGAQRRNFPWGFTFRDPLRSLWTGGKNRCEPAIAVDDAVLVEENEEIKMKEREKEVQNGNWVFKILHVRSLWKEVDEREDKFVEEIGTKLEEEDKIGAMDGKYNGYSENEDCCEELGECDVCGIDEENDNKIEFDRESFSKMLQKVPLAEARLYAQMSYLANLAYSITQIKKKGSSNSGRRVWNILRLALLWARKGGIFRNKFSISLSFLPKGVKSLRHSKGGSGALIYGEPNEHGGPDPCIISTVLPNEKSCEKCVEISKFQQMQGNLHKSSSEGSHKEKGVLGIHHHRRSPRFQVSELVLKSREEFSWIRHKFEVQRVKESGKLLGIF